MMVPFQKVSVVASGAEICPRNICHKSAKATKYRKHAKVIVVFAASLISTANITSFIMKNNWTYPRSVAPPEVPTLVSVGNSPRNLIVSQKWNREFAPGPTGGAVFGTPPYNVFRPGVLAKNQ